MGIRLAYVQEKTSNILCKIVGYFIMIKVEKILNKYVGCLFVLS